MSYTPSNLIAAVRYFSDLKVCNDYMRSIKRKLKGFHPPQ